MIDFKRFEDQLANLESVTLDKWAIFHYLPMTILEFGETRIYRPIKNVALKYLDHFRSGMDPYGFGQLGKLVINEQRQPRDVVKVRVGYHDILYRRPLSRGNRHGKTSRVYCDVPVYQEAGKMLPR